MANPGTRFNRVVSVGAPLAAFSSLAASVMLFVFGTFSVQGVVNFSGVAPSLTGTGTNSTAITHFRRDVTPLVATGATAAAGGENGKYATARWQNPTTQTASLLQVCLNVRTTPSPLTRSTCFINNEGNTGSGSPIYLMKYKPLTKGLLCYTPLGGVSSGTYIPQVGPDEHLKCSNSRGAGSGQGLTGDLEVFYSTNR